MAGLPYSVSLSQVRKDEILHHSHGRAPWYDMNGTPNQAYVIGIAGGSASGKTSVAEAILKSLNNIPTVLVLSQDSFYRKHNEEQIKLAFQNDLDLDHPDAIDTELFVKCLRDLKQGKATEIPVYSFKDHQRMDETKYLYGASVIIVEGIMTLTDPGLRDLYDLKVFVNADSDLMLARRIRRDVRERGRDVEGILDQYLRFVKRAYDNFIQPSSRYADIIVPGFENQVSVKLLVTHIQQQLDSREMRFRDQLAQRGTEEYNRRKSMADSGLTQEVISATGSKVRVSENTVVLEQTNQLRGILTILRDKNTDRSSFIFYADRLSSLVVERSLQLLPYKEKVVTTPVGLEAIGQEMVARDLVGVTILRSGGPFAQGLRRVIQDVKLGSLLIQSDPKTGEPLLFHTSLPESIKKREQAKNTVVFLLDAQVGTGAAALMAIRLMLDHGIRQKNIVFLSFLAAPQGLATVHSAFPSVRVVTASVGEKIEEREFPVHEHIAPGNAAPDGGSGAQQKERGDKQAGKTNKGSAEAEPTKHAWVITPDIGNPGSRYFGV
ncbi:Uridine kinase [Naganishia albida]|nr:Uridine kinase [Naganishia albida]